MNDGYRIRKPAATTALATIARHGAELEERMLGHYHSRYSGPACSTAAENQGSAVMDVNCIHLVASEKAKQGFLICQAPNNAGARQVVEIEALHSARFELL